MPPSSASADATASVQRRRSTRACDRCHRSASKCTPGIVGVGCERCKEYGADCTYHRPIKRRGPLSRRERRTAQSLLISRTASEEPQTQTAQGLVLTEEPAQVSQDSLGLYSVVESIISPEAIESLMEVFYHTIYPMRPYFHWPSFSSQIRQQLYRNDWGVFVVAMATCALTAGRLYDGIPSSMSLCSIRPQSAVISHQCYTAAARAIPHPLSQVNDYYHAMKASALLASVGLQNGDTKTAIVHLGDYISLSLMHNFHVESTWPTELTGIEREERRRLYWFVYQQEQYIVTTFSIPCRQREGKATVQYPTEDFNDNGVTPIGIRNTMRDILQGSNFCTDLYRLSEQIDNVQRACQPGPVDEQGGQSMVVPLLSQMNTPSHFAPNVLHFISKLHDDLPRELKTVRPFSGNLQEDWHGLVAANILLTTHNVKMRIVGLQRASIHARCAIASELLDALSCVPSEFFNTSSTSFLYNLAHFGHMLGSVIESPISAWTYLQVRNILLVLSDFLQKIETARYGATNLASKLRSQVSHIDRCMQQTAQHDSQSLIHSMGQSLLRQPTGQQQPSRSRSVEPPISNGHGDLDSSSPHLSADLTGARGSSDQMQVAGDMIQVQDQQRTCILPTNDHFVTIGQQQSLDDILSIPQQSSAGQSPSAPTLADPLLPSLDFFEGWPILARQADGWV